MTGVIIFLIVALVAILSAALMLISANAVHSALFLVLNFACVAFFFVTLGAPFIALVQIAVYAGAIMVLFLFVIMLLGAEQLRGVEGGSPFHLGLSIVLAGLLVVAFIIVLVMEGGNTSAAAMIDTSPTALGLRLFEGFSFPFLVTGVLLLSATIGVVIFGFSRKRGENV